LVDDRHWMVLPMGAGLANGYLGVALFLAQLSELSGIARYGEVARGALTAVPTLFATLAAQPHLVVAVGPGGLHGFGGIAYALARLATLLADDELRGWAQTATGFAATAVGEPGTPNWATGSAGCLAAMTAVHTELGLSDAARLARGCADQLAAYVRHTATDGRPTDASPDAGKEPAVASGFADGAAGIAYSLARFAAAGGDLGHAQMARLAMSAARSTLGPGESPHGWCQGTAGLMLARAALADGRTEQGWAALLLTDRPVLRDLSLCHGELGIAETLTVLAATGRDSSAAGARRQHAGQILDALNQYGPACGVPGGVPTPGLLSGLAGIGYGLLRLGFAEQVPSVLLLEATPTTSYTPMITETHKERAV
jgi:lantibiotic modifying enzyme